jgi:CheY-like chemotaxis protein
MTARVLVVDDEPDVEALFRQQFRREVREGHCLLDFALSGKAALNKLDGCAGEEIILLLSDINMPGISGLDLLPIVKTRRPKPLARGADEFLTKPVDFPKLRRDIMAVKADAMRRNG